MSPTGKDRVPFTPEFLERYTIRRILGEGGSGVVYEAEQKSLGRVVAIKFLSNHLFKEEESVRRFLDEGKITARLQHGNIVTIYDFGVMGDMPYAVFEFISGKPLRSRLEAERKLAVAESLRITQETLAGLSHAHKLGVVHRDLKPENLLLEPDGRVKIADFGLAKSREKRDYKTRAGVVLGTPEYISPEQASGKDAIPQSDIYSLGIMLYEMLCGVVPFSGTSDLAILIAHVQKPPRPLPELLPGLPTLVWELVSKSLEKDPAKRFGSADEFHDKIEELQPYLGRSTREVPAGVVKAVRASSAARPAATPRISNHSTSEMAQGRRTLVALGAGLGLVVLGAAVGVYMFRGGGGSAFSVESIQVRPGVHTAAIDWKTGTALPGAVELKEENAPADDDWKRVSQTDNNPTLEHHLELSELKPGASYQYRFVYPDGTASIPRLFQTSPAFTPEAIDVVYLTPNQVSLTVHSSQTVRLSFKSQGTERLEAPSDVPGQTHTLKIDEVDPLKGVARASLIATYPGGETIESPLVRVPSLPELMMQDIEKLDAASIIKGLVAQLEGVKDPAKRQALFEERLKKERVYSTYRIFKQISGAFFESAQVQLEVKLAVYERLLALEDFDGLASLYQLQTPLDVPSSYATFISRSYVDPLPDASEFDSVTYETKDAAFFPENFNRKDLTMYRDTLEIAQGRGRTKEVYHFKFRGDPNQRLARAALMCKCTNLPSRLYFEATVNDRLKLVLRNTSKTYAPAGSPPSPIYEVFPTQFLSGAENKVELKLRCLPGLQPVFNSLLYEFGLKAQ